MKVLPLDPQECGAHAGGTVNADMVRRIWYSFGKAVRSESVTTAKLFKLGNSQALRIPARYRIAAQEVEVFARGGDLILRPKARSAADLFARIRDSDADYGGWERPAQGKNKPAPSFD